MISAQALPNETIQKWSFTIDLSYSTEPNNYDVSLPIFPYVEYKYNSNTNNWDPIYTDMSVTVDWGDGTRDTYNAEELNYTGYPSLHTYELSGIYQINIYSKNWNEIVLLLMPSSLSNVLVSLDSPLPKIYGTYDSYPNVYYANELHWTFSRCTHLKSIPENLFIYNSHLTSISYCFEHCYSITSIPEHLFDNLVNLEGIYGVFSNCTSLTSIPENIFKYNTNLLDVGYCFGYCHLLTSIPQNLFKYNIKTTHAGGCFTGCYALIDIPQQLFNNCPDIVYFGSCFSHCTSLTSIPENIFKYNTEVLDFNDCFYGCSNLISIPTDLFKYNTKVTNFKRCFYECTSLTTIPENLFKYNTEVVSFGSNYNWSIEGCFSGCTSLLSIPENLFKYNTKVQYFGACFYDCTNLDDFTLHIGSSLVSIASYFVKKKLNTTRTIYVPDNSTTQTTFNSYASTYGLTIIGE